MVGRRPAKPRINWERQAHWFEAEGGKPKPPAKGKRFDYLTVVSQNIARQDIVDKRCKELRQAGFTICTPPIHKDTKVCQIKRVEEQRCYIERTQPHYLSEETKQWAKSYLAEIDRREKGKKKRKPFPCPE